MRRIVMFNNVSADGCFSDAQGGLGWVVQDAELNRANAAAAAASVEGSGTILFGRRTYEMFAAFWPHVARDTPAPHGRGPLGPEMLAMADMLNRSEKVVFSRTLQEPSWRGTRVLRALDPQAIEAMKRGPGSDIMVFGSGSVVSQLTQHRLIDEYQMVVSPVALGPGKRLFEELPHAARLRLLDAKPYPSGVVMLRYAPEKA
jgi:dihydrofolate reductase